MTTIFDAVKKATVALAVLHEQDPPLPSREQPFTIVGSGFCVHPKGVVLTCAHVIEAFMEKTIKEQIESIPPEERKKTGPHKIPDVKTLVQHALFYLSRPDRHEVVVVCAPVDIGVAKTDKDVAAVRLHPHPAFSSGYPIVDIEDFDNLHEGMEVGTCGFPLGNLLFKQLGTVTSSFSRGIVSSILPAPGVSRKDLKGFQLDLRATHGNSGGPVISWSTGRVLGILQGGINDQYGTFLFSRAESIYRLLDEKFIEDALADHPAF